MDADKLIDSIDTLINEARALLTKVDDLKGEVEEEYEGDEGESETAYDALDNAGSALDEAITSLGRAKP